MIEANYRQVEENIIAACKEVGRDPSEVTLIAVSKTKPVELLKEAYDAGARFYGENKVQEIQEKYEQLYSEYAQLHDYFGRGENKVMERLTMQRKI